MTTCRICQARISPFISYGRMPIANGFLTPSDFDGEYFYEMKVAFCEQCGMVQLVDQPDPEQMFNEHYHFFSGTSKLMGIHFKQFAEQVISDHLKEKNDPFVVEIGSNDGIMLQHFAAHGIRHLGIEPSANVAAVAREKGIQTICRFFNEETARAIVKEHGQADAFLAANVMCHIPFFHSIIAGIKILLKDNGIVMFEDPYLGDVIEKTSYDQIYDEHVFLFSLRSICYAFAQHGLELVDIEPQTTHGGSMRYVIAHKGARPVSPAVLSQLRKEEGLGLHMPETYEIFRRNCEKSRSELKSLLERLKTEGKRVVGYGATSKSTTVINYCGITPDLIEFISDTTPAKQGKFTPGAHIPVKPYGDFVARYPDYALLFAWNHSVEIMAKEGDFRDGGGKWIVYVPQVQVIE
ncbi:MULTISPECIES: class I SAM-dependent methyltransferase [Geobacter]|uniref:class I SAM-dependent methyltransferase n=1 Tax=Geobacter TaxID=28231 RepID=UPI0025746661|nr:class I SAM-dependent methyltransferase [Geobacter sulfurreducens]BEH11542.1 class I SAM-dependent methyltransferase [Geobacter sulfurreducens subsp. ethanolicus]BET59398.1 class I SAM-dependent methyltransferase [Geobacter sp. 60473]